MAYVYLIKYKVNYTFETKYKAFCTFVEASNFHKNYKNHLLENAFITHYEILVLEVDMNCTNPEKH
ncbi:hypothetical protein [Spiroplasma endosymbiont of Danaus chrysippus]|uniref:hypothetical protein n=1 Tax=Spiroplasma endosymbiont of Danaus chrysippus TaxID=2691041 RepID=UPI00157ABB3F|nr:hypothetical protein [Spiroplasma endosymbiont of Danaus chrysippus]